MNGYDKKQDSSPMMGIAIAVIISLGIIVLITLILSNCGG